MFCHIHRHKAASRERLLMAASCRSTSPNLAGLTITPHTENPSEFPSTQPSKNGASDGAVLPYRKHFFSVWMNGNWGSCEALTIRLMIALDSE
jgi:hypothetical protein